MKKKFFLSIALMLCAGLEPLAASPQAVQQKLVVADKSSAEAFPIVVAGQPAPLFVSPAEAAVVKKTAAMFADDVERVTGRKPSLAFSKKVSGRQAIVLGTLGNSPFIDKLVKQGKLNVRAIAGGWEQYLIQVVKNPAKGIDEALVVVGSDKRGAAYGMLNVSEKMGVSPFFWWSDVPVKHRNEVWLSGTETSKKPSVKYRGFFINDEDWGLKTWASGNYEKTLGDIGPKTYAKVCELTLRLRGNMLGPAMHECTGAFYSHPESKLVADSFGIMITTSHCEPLLINTASKWEWDVKRDGDWNYATNAKGIQKKWNDRLDEASRFDNIYTMGMRGLHDAGLRGKLPIDQQTKLIGQVIADQRTLLTNHIKKNIKDIPQIYIPYKEAMDVYENGLQVPDDITQVWVDDNYGYMKRVSNPQEQKRKGGAGVYYHLSYLGAPHDYLWINTTPPVLMYEELMKAYNTGADRYWLLNVGDIKPMELGIKTFFDLAWNVDDYDISSINRHQSQFLGSVFGNAYTSRFQDILDSYYRLAWSRKPEFMGWERKWDKKEYTGLRDTEFSFQNYSEAQRRLRDYENLSNDVKALMDELPKAQRAAFFELLGHPVMASYQMNRKFLMAQLNHELFAGGKKEQANWAARQARQAYDSIAVLNREFNTLLGGKWNGMMNMAPAWCSLSHKMPEVNVSPDADEEPVNLSVKDEAPASDNGLTDEKTTASDKKNASRQYCVVDLSQYINKVEKAGNRISLVKGLGYDWEVVQLGRPTDKGGDATDVNGDRIEYRLPAIQSSQVEITLYTVPFFPIYKGKATKIGVSVDGCAPQVFDNQFKEYGLTWKNQVLRNGAVAKMTFTIDPSKPSHQLAFICGDAGMMIQKVIVDWGGLKKSYLGPQTGD